MSKSMINPSLPLLVFFIIALIIAILEHSTFFVKMHSFGIVACIISNLIFYKINKNKRP